MSSVRFGWLTLLVLAGCHGKSVTDSAVNSATNPGIAALPHEGTSAEVVDIYKQLKLLTPEPVYVDEPDRNSGACYVPVSRGPHAYNYIRIYMNQAAADTFTTANPYKEIDAYPVGSVIVKEKLDMASDKHHAGIGGMIKRPAGYAPERGDWEFFYMDADGALATGRLEKCADCHHRYRHHDYVFGDWRQHPAAGFLLRNYKDFTKMSPEPYVTGLADIQFCQPPTPSDDKLDYGPHGSYQWVRILMNDVAAKAFRRETEYPIGSVILKEKLTQKDATEPDAGIGGMIKRGEGYAPENGNWEYFYQDASGKLIAQNLQKCATCHNDPKTKDHVYGTWEP